MTSSQSINQLLDETVRRERGWLIASLVSRLGPAKVDLAEDVAQDAVLKALATWPYKGIPDNPRAWLRRVAGNIAIDQIRRSSRELGIDDQWDLASEETDIITPSLSDPELDLLVLCCDPSISAPDQLCLALKTVCGFTAQDTAALFFLTPDALAQRMARAKRVLRAQAGNLARFPTRFALNDRLPQMLKAIYLMFSWGYLPKRGADLYHDDICAEARRLSESLLAAMPNAATGQHALHALILLQSARFPARQGEDGALLTLEDQDRTKWDAGLIQDALGHLQQSRTTTHVTRYHLEAGIAAVHARAPSWSDTDWGEISRYYQALNIVAPSLAVSVNHAVSEIMRDDLDAAARVLDHAGVMPSAERFAPFHLALARLAQARGDQAAQRSALEQAQRCAASAPILDHVARQLGALPELD